MAYQSDAAGTKIIGVLCIEYYNQHIDVNNGTLYGDAKIVARLRKGSDLKVLYGEAYRVNLDNVPSNQASITAVMKPKVLEAFFTGQTGLDVTLKSVEEYGDIDVNVNNVTYVVFDVQLAVK
jgi:hypothetical protein